MFAVLFIANFPETSTCRILPGAGAGGLAKSNPRALVHFGLHDARATICFSRILDRADVPPAQLGQKSQARVIWSWFCRCRLAR